MGFLSQLGWQGILALVNQLLPIVSASVHAVEAANPQKGDGPSKFSQVLNAVVPVALALPQITTAVQASGKAITDAAHSGDVAALTAASGQLINIAVGLANATGSFQKSGFIQALNAAQNAAGAKPGD